MLMMLFPGAPMATQLRIDVNVMPRIVFTGDSQTVGCVGAVDYAQMMSWEVPLRVFNRSVGGSNTTHLLYEFGGGTATVKAGEQVVHGESVGWYAGPYLGQKVRFGPHEYTLDSIETTDYANHRANLHLAEPAREDYSGTDYRFEPGWRVRIAELRPQYACFMYTVNDPGWTPEEFKARLAEITRRCREANTQPIFLSGVPFMDAAAGGSHPGTVARTMQRAQDLQEFCQQEKLPFGDVFRTLELLDAQHTAEWADTIHPTTDGSVVIVHALRYILKELGATGNPYSLRGYRAAGADLPNPPSGGLQPITTGQPRRDKDNRLNEAGFNLEAQRLRDEYGLLAEADGQALESRTPLVFRLGVGEVAKLQSAEAEVVLASPGEVCVYSARQQAWLPLVQGQERLAAALPEPLADLVAGDALWLAVRGERTAVDYVALSVTGDVAPWQPPRCDRAIVWPTPGQFDWTQDGSLLPNGALTQAAGDRPAGWAGEGAAARYLPAGAVAGGSGEFCGPRGDQFRCAGAKFTQTVRPLDMLQARADLEGGANFLVERVIDDGTLDLRRSPKVAPGLVGFEVRRESGLRAVPGGCCLEVGPESEWRTTVPVQEGQYHLSFFCRVFAPAHMDAANQASRTAEVVVSDEQGNELGRAADEECSYVWLRGSLGLAVPRATRVTITCRHRGKATEAVQYTGLHLHRR